MQLEMSEIIDEVEKFHRIVVVLRTYCRELDEYDEDMAIIMLFLNMLHKESDNLLCKLQGFDED